MGQRRRANNHRNEDEVQVPPSLMSCSRYMNIRWPGVNRFHFSTPRSARVCCPLGEPGSLTVNRCQLGGQQHMDIRMLNVRSGKCKKSSRRGGLPWNVRGGEGENSGCSFLFCFFLYIVTSSSCSCVHVCEEKPQSGHCVGTFPTSLLVWALDTRRHKTESGSWQGLLMLRRVVRTLPSPTSHVVWAPHSPQDSRPDMVWTARRPDNTEWHSVNEAWGRIDDNLAWLKIGHMLESAWLHNIFRNFELHWKPNHTDFLFLFLYPGKLILGNQIPGNQGGKGPNLANTL